MTDIYGQPKQHNQGSVIVGNCWCRSPQQLMLLEKILVKAMEDCRGEAEQTIIAQWHNEAVNSLESSKSRKWLGWEDHYPLAFKGKETRND